MDNKQLRQKTGVSNHKKLKVKDPVRLDLLGRSILLSLAVIFTLLGILAAYWVGHIFVETKRLEHLGSSIQAAVSARTEQAIEKKNNKGKKYRVHHYKVTYQFEIMMPDGQQRTFSRTEQVTEERYQQITEGAELLIVYQSENPSNSRIKGNYVILDGDKTALSVFSSRGGVLFFLLIAATLVGVFFVIAIPFWIVRDSVTLWFLYRRGRVTAASIIDISESLVDKEKKAVQYTITYRFQPDDDSGEATAVTGSHEIRQREYEACSKQKTVTVKYLPTKPERFKVIRND